MMQAKTKSLPPVFYINLFKDDIANHWWYELHTLWGTFKEKGYDIRNDAHDAAMKHYCRLVDENNSLKTNNTSKEAQGKLGELIKRHQ